MIGFDLGRTCAREFGVGEGEQLTAADHASFVYIHHYISRISHPSHCPLFPVGPPLKESE